MSIKTPIYLDYAASTPLAPEVIDKMTRCLQSDFGNASSMHRYGRNAAQAIEYARVQVAALINAQAHEIIWTSGATEANNLAIKGVARARQHAGRHIITTPIEHSSVLGSCAQLAQEGFEITYLPVAENGSLDLSALQQVLRADTILVSVMHVNNEMGVVQDIAKIGQILKESKTYFHVDAVQSVGKIPLDLAQLPVDLMSFSAHKLYGPKGIGALYINQARTPQLQPLLQGGGQERGLRPGTLVTHQIVGMGEAFCLAQQRFAEDLSHLKNLGERLWRGMQQLDNVYLMGETAPRAPHILNVAFSGISAKTLLPALKDLALSTGAACHASQAQSSSVLRSLGSSTALIESSIRISFGRYTTEAEIDFAVEKIVASVKALRQL